MFNVAGVILKLFQFFSTNHRRWLSCLVFSHLHCWRSETKERHTSSLHLPLSLANVVHSTRFMLVHCPVADVVAPSSSRSSSAPCVIQPTFENVCRPTAILCSDHVAEVLQLSLPDSGCKFSVCAARSTPIHSSFQLILNMRLYHVISKASDLSMSLALCPWFSPVHCDWPH